MITYCNCGSNVVIGHSLTPVQIQKKYFKFIFYSIDKELVGHFWKTKQSSCCKSVLLTGATGFLGSFLLCDLLLQTKVTQLFICTAPHVNSYGILYLRESYEPAIQNILMYYTSATTSASQLYLQILEKELP